MKKNDTETIVQFVGEIDEKRYVVRHADGHLEIKEDQTDWARFDALTDEDIERSIEGDPDWEPFRDIDWSKGGAHRPERAQDADLDPAGCRRAGLL